MADVAGLPSSCRVGSRVQIVADDLSLGQDVVIGDDVVIVGDKVIIDDNARLGAGVDIRGREIRIGPASEISSDVQVLVAERFEVGAAARIASGCRVLCRTFEAGRLLYMGDGATVGYGGTLASTSRVRIGNRVTIGQHTILNANFPIDIGDNVGTGSYLAIWTHGYHFGHGPLNGTEPAYAPVRVGRNVWLGFHVTILPGVAIGDDTMVAAGSVVTTDLPPSVLAGGVPAKVKKEIDVSPVSADLAFDAVVRVLRTWHVELEWKGCTIESVVEGVDRLTMVVAAPGGDDRLAVVLPSAPEAGEPIGEAGQPVVLLNLALSPHTAPIEAMMTVFDLHLGQLRGRRSPLVEDLRDHLRRHAMPCGDDSCFVAIEPEAFRTLRAAIPAVPDAGAEPL